MYSRSYLLACSIYFNTFKFCYCLEMNVVFFSCDLFSCILTHICFVYWKRHDRCIFSISFCIVYTVSFCFHLSLEIKHVKYASLKDLRTAWYHDTASPHHPYRIAQHISIHCKCNVNWNPIAINTCTMFYYYEFLPIFFSFFIYRL